MGDSHRLLVLLHSSQFRCILLLFFGPDPEPVADALLGPEVDSGKGVGPPGGPEGILTVGISILIVHPVPSISRTSGASGNCGHSGQDVRWVGRYEKRTRYGL